MIKRLLSAVCVYVVFTGVASATPTTFDLQNVTFTDGTSLTGSFVYDPTTGDFGTFDLATSADAPFPTFTFTPTDSFVFLGNALALDLVSDNAFSDPSAPQDETLVLDLYFDSALNASGNPITIDTSFGSYECLNCFPYRVVSGGSVIAEPSVTTTPEPSSLALLGTSILGFAGVMRKRFA